MQQMQYHGIASYKFEYQLTTGGDWQTALDTTASTANSYEYTYGSLTGGKSYNLRVTVTDRAGNSSTGTNTGTTVKSEKNPGGIITDIVSDDTLQPILPSTDFNTIKQTPVNYEYEEKKVFISSSICGSTNEITGTVTGNWLLLYETRRFLLLV